MKSTRANVVLECPGCAGDNFTALEEFTVTNATLDCVHCGVALLYKDFRVYLFHEYMHKEDSRWPKDGEGTRCIDIK